MKVTGCLIPELLVPHSILSQGTYLLFQEACASDRREVTRSEELLNLRCFLGGLGSMVPFSRLGANCCHPKLSGGHIVDVTRIQGGGEF